MKKIIVAVILIILMYFTLQWCAISQKHDQLKSTSVEKTENIDNNQT